MEAKYSTIHKRLSTSSQKLYNMSRVSQGYSDHSLNSINGLAFWRFRKIPKSDC